MIPLYKESLAVGKRDVDAGSVRVKKVVKTETVNQPVGNCTPRGGCDRTECRPLRDAEGSSGGAESAFKGTGNRHSPDEEEEPKFG